MSYNNLEIRRGQTIQPFGAGSIIEIDGESYIVKDISQWKKPTKTITLDRVQTLLPGKKLLSFQDFNSKDEYITLDRFPAWYHCSSCNHLRKVKKNEPSPIKCKKCTNIKMSPMRFVAYCDNGHLTDIDWGKFAHSSGHESTHGQCSGNEEIYFSNTGRSGGDWDQMLVRCKACNRPPKSMQELQPEVPKSAIWNKKGQKCCGNQPYDSGEKSDCSQTMKFEPKGSSSIWRGLTLSALDIETSDNLSEIESSERFILLLEGIGDDYLTAEIPLAIDEIIETNSRRIRRIASSYEVSDKKVQSLLKKHLLSTPEASENKVNSDDDPQIQILNDELSFFRLRENVDLRNFKIEFIETHSNHNILSLLFSSVAMVRRLREIRVLKGFIRGKGLEDRLLGGESNEVSTDWLPTIEAFGEGIYFELNADVLKEYFQENKNDISEFTLKQIAKLKELKENYNNLNIPESSLFVLTHTLSHQLIRQLTFDSGYSSSALKERIYIDENNYYAGILIYTSELDSEGTLGGLVDQARLDRLSKVLNQILENSNWCSTDPVCRETESQGFSNLNRSACHCCALISETSCVYHNAMLNRLLLGGYGRDRKNEVLGLFNYVNQRL